MKVQGGSVGSTEGEVKRGRPTLPPPVESL